jgi:hypothetical protein
MKSAKINSKSNLSTLVIAIIIGIILAVISSEIAFSLLSKRSSISGWSVNYDLGRVSGAIRKAVVAKVGLGALVAEEALYYSNYRDSEGLLLNGNSRYRLHFARNQLPSVDGFWSLSLYDQDHFFVQNPINRYSLGDQSSLNYNKDGSLDIIVASHHRVGDPNWLPSGSGDFMLTLRAYLPNENLLQGDWMPPSIERIQLLEKTY